MDKRFAGLLAKNADPVPMKRHMRRKALAIALTLT